MNAEELLSAVPENVWLDDMAACVSEQASAIQAAFPAVGRHCGRSPLDALPGWSTDDAARVRLLLALPLTGAALAGEVADLYRYGDADEKRAILRGLPLLAVGDACVDLLRDALRANDTRLVAAALGPYAGHLDDAAWRQGVLKCVFMGLPLSVVDDLATRADQGLADMLGALASERSAAGRAMPDDATALLERLTQGDGSRAHL